MAKSKYEKYVLPRLADIQKWCGEITEKEMAKQLGIAYSTFNKYKIEYKELSEALKKGYENRLVPLLKSALKKRALGYKFKELKVIVEERELPEELKEILIEAGFNPKDFRRVVRKEMTYKHMAPDVAAINLSLKNYDKDNWANDPQMLALKREELELKKENNW